MLYEIFQENRKIKFGLLFSSLTFMNSHFHKQGWKKTINNETNKTQFNSLITIFQNNALSETLISHILTKNS